MSTDHQDYLYVGDTLADLWNLFGQWLQTKLDYFRTSGDGVVGDPVVSAYDGRAGIKISVVFPSTGFTLNFQFVAILVPEIAVVPIGMLIAMPGFQTSGSFLGPYPDDGYSDYQAGLSRVWGAAKALIIDTWTDGTPTAETITFASAIGDQSAQGLLTIRIDTDRESYITYDTFRVVVSADADVQILGVVSPALPATAPTPAPAQVDLASLIQVLRDIALRDFTVRFNHGAQQFSAEGGVAIP